MKPKIAVILPGPLLPGVRAKMPPNIMLVDKALIEAADIAQKIEKEGIEIIISRGGTAKAISQAVTVPVVTAEATAFDILETVWDIKKNLPEAKKIGIINFGDTRYDTTTMNEILQLSLEQYNYYRQEDLLRCIREAVAKGIEIIIGGTLTVHYATKLGITGVLQQIGNETITQAITRAREIMLIRRRDKAKTEQIRSIMNSIREGVMAIDGEGIITIFNPAAEKILNIPAKYVIGYPLIEVFPNLNWDEALINGNYNFDRIDKVRGTQIIANRFPIKVNKKIVGVVSTFQRLDNIQKAEEIIRKEIYIKGLHAQYKFSDIIGESKVMKDLIRRAALYAQSDSTVLITGESGTGKEIFVHSIHQACPRRDGPFVAVNCAALPEQLLESELFGYDEGAFTGAKKGGKQGMFELAHNGTIFLDEIGDMPISLQARLLRILQNKEIMRIGGEKVIPVNVRIILATNQDLNRAIQRGKFRKDLYYRINVLNLRLPPLREHREDIPLLFEHFVQKYGKIYNKGKIEISENIVRKLMNHEWPGNVRELENFAEKYCLLSEEVSSWEMLDNISSMIAENNKERDEGLYLKLPVRELNEMTNEIIKQVYELTGRNKNKTALYLGLSRTTIWSKLKAGD